MRKLTLGLFLGVLICIVVVGVFLFGIVDSDIFSNSKNNTSSTVGTASFAQFISDIGYCASGSENRAVVENVTVLQSDDLIQINGTLIVTNSTYKATQGDVVSHRDGIRVTIRQESRDTYGQISCSFAIPYKTVVLVENKTKPYTVQIIHNGTSEQVVLNESIE